MTNESKARKAMGLSAMSEREFGEKCSCGHCRGLHHDSAAGLAKGHGECAVDSCDCRKFTWVSMR